MISYVVLVAVLVLGDPTQIRLNDMGLMTIVFLVVYMAEPIITKVINS